MEICNKNPLAYGERSTKMLLSATLDTSWKIRLFMYSVFHTSGHRMQLSYSLGGKPDNNTIYNWLTNPNKEICNKYPITFSQRSIKMLLFATLDTRWKTADSFFRLSIHSVFRLLIHLLSMKMPPLHHLLKKRRETGDRSVRYLSLSCFIWDLVVLFIQYNGEFSLTLIDAVYTKIPKIASH